MKRASALLLLLSLLLGAVALSACAAVEKETVTEGEFTFIVSKRGDTVIGIEVESPYSYWFVCRPRALRQRPVRLFRDWLMATLRD